MPFLQNIGTTELIIIGIVLLLLFGGKVLGRWAKGLGETGRELKKVRNEFTTALNDETETPALKSKGQKKKGVE